MTRTAKGDSHVWAYNGGGLCRGVWHDASCRIIKSLVVPFWGWRTQKHTVSIRRLYGHGIAVYWSVRVSVRIFIMKQRYMAIRRIYAINGGIWWEIPIFDDGYLSQFITRSCTTHQRICWDERMWPPWKNFGVVFLFILMSSGYSFNLLQFKTYRAYKQIPDTMNSNWK